MSHYKPYPAYKDSGVEWLGRVPEHWTIGPYKATIQIENGSDYKEVEADDGYPVIGSGGPFAYSSKLMYDGESVLLGRKGTIDKPLYVNGAFWAVDTMYWSIIKPGAHGRFAYYTATTIPFDMYSTNTALPSMTKSVLGSHVVAFPGFEEQQAIAGHLDRETARIDALVEKKIRFIELLREKRQALITHAVTKGLDPSVKMKDSGVEWLGAVPEHWVIKRFRDICISISTGPFGTALGNEDYITGGIPVINPSHIIDEQCSPDPDITVSTETALRLSFWAMRAGDLVTARRGELGRAAIIFGEQDGWICGTGSLRVRPNPSQALTEYLHTVLQSRYAREWLNLASVGATMANLNEGILGSLPLALPPSTAEQEKLLSSLAAQSERLIKIEQKAALSVALLKECRSALITAAVTGQIDLREAV
ncbi:type I restriction-modification system, S subunit [Stutzerimonas stutzeri A1501]|uniref:Type I restriction-modification system, S subunit n=2 Tax=Stutzerimonas stutzeri TaxID=316 RepID=A4VG57_STUS1|nr:restriction endonuclease subunit S [Stutzerimonas stutzeri]ABP77958.1 type I restriction-modification system, S subunit [Stutzerimonas stutzeri A1501]MBA1307413.1 restriction endonuclease subunit S [Stutzerimonas stutzeri]UWG60816.1 restriction endonuclease subunit S [Stutzerimonas stutzeri]